MIIFWKSGGNQLSKSEKTVSEEPRRGRRIKAGKEIICFLHESPTFLLFSGFRNEERMRKCRRQMKINQKFCVTESST